jgi:PAP_fibrillin
MRARGKSWSPFGATPLLVVLLALSSISAATGFALTAATRTRTTLSLSSTAPTIDVDSIPVEQDDDEVLARISVAKNRVLQVAQRLKDDYGVVVSRLVANESEVQDLDAATRELEAASAESVSFPSFEALLGEWTLLCSASSSSSTAAAATTSPLADLKTALQTSPLVQPWNEIRQTVVKASNKYVSVQQIISAAGSGIDRVDHVISYTPPSKLADLVPELPDVLQSLDLNPLQLNQVKATLVHSASIVPTVTPITVEITLKSIVLNVAGTSSVLKVDGQDVLDLQLPPPIQTEFFSTNTGRFETTYVDETLRISRSKLLGVDQLRIFVRNVGAAAAETDALNEEEEVDDASESSTDDADVSPSD